MVLILCATIMFVLLFVLFAKASLNAASVLKSSAEKLSSNTNISGSFATALAIDNLCFCPPETLLPPCAISDLYLSSFPSINSVACAISAASIIFSSDILSSEYFILLSIVPENNTPFCGTNPIASLNSFCDKSFTFTPSTKSSPPVTS